MHPAGGFAVILCMYPFGETLPVWVIDPHWAHFYNALRNEERILQKEIIQCLRQSKKS
jgi:hypothetical protein